jgi:DNA-binding beta-propeller fold protein YncE
MPHPKPAALAFAACLAAPAVVGAEIALSANDTKGALENGRIRVLPEAAPDTLSVIDLSADPPALHAEIPVPASVVGPPDSVALTPDERLALVTANQVPDPAGPGRTTAGNTMAVVDLAASPPRLLATLPTGAGPAGVSVNREGTLALVANRSEGMVSLYRIRGQEVTPTGKVEVGPAAPAAPPAVPPGMITG